MSTASVWLGIRRLEDLLMLRKKIITAIACFLLCMQSMVVQAEVVQVPATEVESVYDQAVQSNQLENWAQGPQIYSESGIVMDMDSGAILYAKNIHDQHYPASITKILTGLAALEHTQLTDKVKFSKDDIYFLEYGDAHIGMNVDEEISMEDALYGMLLASANEVAHAIASNTEGGYDHFIQLMNEKVAELGGVDSHFSNTNGLHADDHYTSAYDMALIASAAFQYEKFREITNTYQYTIGTTNLTNETRTFQQNHKMIREWDSRYYEYCVGGKTGYTDQALTTLVTYAVKEDRRLVSVVMRTHGGGNNAYVDTRAMLEYGFNHFSKVPVTLEEVGDSRYAALEEQAYVVLPNGISLEQLQCAKTDPVNIGDKVGKLVYTYQDQVVGTVDATITEAYYNEIHGIEEDVESPESKDKTNALSAIGKVILIVVAVLAVFFILLMVFRLFRRKRNEEYRRYRRIRRRRKLAEKRRKRRFD